MPLPILHEAVELGGGATTGGRGGGRGFGVRGSHRTVRKLSVADRVWQVRTAASRLGSSRLLAIELAVDLAVDLVIELPVVARDGAGVVERPFRRAGKAEVDRRRTRTASRPLRTPLRTPHGLRRNRRCRGGRRHGHATGGAISRIYRQSSRGDGPASLRRVRSVSVRHRGPIRGLVGICCRSSRSTIARSDPDFQSFAVESRLGLR